ncbi:MAG: thiamine phosphate synthase [Planctomycetaceae bacterium]|nr:thiamine phosphate synthase [Planctomycetaceae bacterium]
MDSLHRTLDAAANRCREGVRVVEDFVRFQLNQPQLSEQCKTFRHGLTSALQLVGSDAWIAVRDSHHDVGREITTPQEKQRGSVEDVVRANCKRVEEALRSLEEFGKVINTDFATRIEQLRYEFYSIEQALSARLRSERLLAGRHLYLLLEEARCRLPWQQVAEESLAGGVGIIQLREKQFSDRELLERARVLRRLTTAANALLIINDRVDIALLSGADGVHIGQEDLALNDVRRLSQSQLLIGVSTHSVEQLQEAIQQNVDYVGLGPVFPSETKNFETFAGLEYLRQSINLTPIPAFAIGGIDLGNVGDVASTCVNRIAVSGAICQATNPQAAAEALLTQLRETN